jgi:putative PEP-CTERM system histidine kinase
LLLLLGHDTLLTASIEEMDGLRWRLEMGWAAYLLCFFMVAASVLVLKNLEQTFRASVGTQRWRLKLVMLGVGALFAARVYAASQALLYRAVLDNVILLNGVALIVACLFVAVSMVRTGEFSIDIYPSQAALQRSVVVILVGGYLVVVGVLAKVAGWLGDAGNFQLNALVVFLALVALALALMSDRLREAGHAWLTRHFHRPHHDYRKLWQSFTTTTAGHVTEDAACMALAKWLSQTLGALSVSVWLLDEGTGELRAAGSTLDSEQLPDRSTTGVDWPALAQAARNLHQVQNLGGEQRPDSPVLGRLQPRLFPNGGDRWVVPLRADDGCLGVLMVGDRVAGWPMSLEDLDLLQTVAEQAASLLTGLRDARRLMDLREMEAFQSMSTFFVHDLKNTVSGLSLMLQNLPRHFDNPEFREDALRSIRRSVAHINQMIESLSALRRKLVLDAKPGDLAELRSCVERLAGERGRCGSIATRSNGLSPICSSTPRRPRPMARPSRYKRRKQAGWRG